MAKNFRLFGRGWAAAWLVWLAYPGLAVVGAGEPSKVFRAAAVAVDITPQKYPVSMTGSFSDRKARSAHDRLHARCLVLDDGRSRAAIVVVDNCLISREIFDAAKQAAEKTTGIPAGRMMMSTTHTHTAPTAVALAQVSPDPDYVRFLTAQIAKSVEQATAALAPARVGWAVATEPNEVFNRRWRVKPGVIRPNPFGQSDDKVRTNPPRGSSDLIEPVGPTDPEIGFLAVQSVDGRPIALLANYSLHYVGGVPGGQVSADYFGEFARQIKQRILGDAADGPFVGILSNGTSGDINNLNFRNPRPPAKPFERIRAVAGNVAEATFAEYKKMRYETWVPLQMAEREIELGVRQPDEAELKRAREILAAAAGPALKGLSEVYSRETVHLSEHPGTVKIKLQVLRVGGLGIVAIPCEVFAEIGLEIKKRSPLKPTFTICLANGYNGYLPTPEQHALAGYETWRCGWSYLEVPASAKITKNVLDLLEEVSRSEN